MGLNTEQPTLPLGAIQVHPHNVRRELGDLSDITETIPTVGILQPLVVSPIGEIKGECPRCHQRLVPSAGGFIPAHQTGKLPVRCPGSSRHPVNVRPDYMLIAGHRRLAAAKLSDLKEVPVTIRADFETEAEQIVAMCVENFNRVDLSPAEEAAAYKMVLDFGDWTPKRIADATGRSERTVKLRIGLTRLPAPTLDRVHDGQISIEEAEVLASFAKDPAAMAELEEHVGTRNFRLHVQRLKDEAEHTKKAAALNRQLLADGVRVIDAPDGYPWKSTQRRLVDMSHVDPEAHEGCPGHAVVVVSNSSGTRAEPVCVDPVEYGHTAPAGTYPTAAELAEEDDDPDAVEVNLDHAKVSEAFARRNEALVAAEKVREDFIGKCIFLPELTASNLALIRGVLRATVDELEEYGGLDRLARMVIRDYEDLDLDDQRAAVDHLIDRAANMTALVHLLACATHANFAPLSQAGWSNREGLWIATLKELGYELSDIEHELWVKHLGENRPIETVPVSDAL